VAAIPRLHFRYDRGANRRVSPRLSLVALSAAAFPAISTAGVRPTTAAPGSAGGSSNCVVHCLRFPRNSRLPDYPVTSIYYRFFQTRPIFQAEHSGSQDELHRVLLQMNSINARAASEFRLGNC
jgi:hypothetical protein